MSTLHIEHLVTDFTTWTAAFSGFANVQFGRENGDTR
jgi:hypothetical protein